MNATFSRRRLVSEAPSFLRLGRVALIHPPIVSNVCRAIIASSSVGITRSWITPRAACREAVGRYLSGLLKGGRGRGVLAAAIADAKA